MLKPPHILIILIVTIILIIVLTIFQNTQSYQNSKLRIFFNMINIISFILLGIGLIMTSYAIVEGHNINRIKQTDIINDRSFIKPIKSMNRLFDHCPNFIASLWPQKNIFQNVNKDVNKNVSDVKDKESSILELSAVMLQSMEDQLLSKKYDSSGEWEATFLQWCSSPKFYEMFLSLYPNYKDKTVEYAKIVFEYAQKYPIKTGDDLDKVAKMINQDQRIKNIYKKL